MLLCHAEAILLLITPDIYTSSYTITFYKLLVSPVCVVHSFSHMISCLGFAIYYLLLGLEGSIALFITMQQAGSYILPKMFVGQIKPRGGGSNLTPTVNERFRTPVFSGLYKKNY